MTSPHNRAARGALFFAIGVGVASFFLSLFALIMLGFATGFEPLEISFTPLSQPHLTWWEAVSLLASLGLSVLTAKFTFRYCKKYIYQGNPPL
jgi:hypothetical protein